MQSPNDSSGYRDRAVRAIESLQDGTFTCSCPAVTNLGARRRTAARNVQDRAGVENSRRLSVSRKRENGCVTTPTKAWPPDNAH